MYIICLVTEKVSDALKKLIESQRKESFGGTAESFRLPFLDLGGIKTRRGASSAKMRCSKVMGPVGFPKDILLGFGTFLLSSPPKRAAIEVLLIVGGLRPNTPPAGNIRDELIDSSTIK